MKNFNQARGDAEWGVIATYHMIEICCNPDNNTLGSETFDSASSPEYVKFVAVLFGGLQVSMQPGRRAVILC